MTKFLTMSALLLSSLVAGCSSSNDEPSTTVTPPSTTETAPSTTESAPSNQSNQSSSSSAAGTNTVNSPTAYTTTSNVTLDDFFSGRDQRTTIDSETPVTLTFTGSSIAATGEDTSGVTIDGSTVTISKEGSYILTGSLSDGQVIVNMADSTEKAQLVLDNVSIHSTTEAPIHVQSADKVFVTMTEGSENHLTAALPDTASTDGAVHSKCDITFNGEGTLYVDITGGDGLVGKDELTITSGTYHINTDGHGLDSNDGIAILDGTFHITAGKDGMHSEHSTNASKGYIFIADGTFDITATRDGLDAGYYLEIWDGTFDIITNGGWSAAPVKVAAANTHGGGMMGGMGQMGTGGRGDMATLTDGDIDTLKAQILAMFPEAAAILDEITTVEQLQQAMMDMMAMGGQSGRPEMEQGVMGQQGAMGQVDQQGQQAAMGQQGVMGQVDQQGQQAAMGQQGVMGQVDQQGQQAAMGQQGVMGQVDQQGQQAAMGQQGAMGQVDQQGQQGAMGQTAMTPLPDGFVYDDPTAVEDVSSSTKGLKAAGAIRLFGGTFVLDCYDDAIHSDVSVEIHDGDYEISTADDAVHANWDTIITDGNINIITCFEGIEGQRIQIAGGSIDMYCGDDGINAATVNADPDNSAIYLFISGGNITMDTNAEGDGVDSNGSILITGGNLLVSSTTDVRDTALDSQYDSIITGGTFIATGSNSATIQNFNDGSTQGSILQILTAITEGQVTLTDSKGNVLVDFLPVKAYQGVHISIPELAVGETYTLVTGDVTNIVTMETLQQGGGASSSRPGGR